jgi:thiol-disulfide isomerase/thioredoxin
MKPILQGVVMTLIVAGGLWLGWLKYKSFLTQGMRPTESTLILNKMEKSGIPLFETQDIQGRPVRLKDFQNKVVIINFWASWCVPCVKEFPSMVRLLKRFPDDMVLLAFSHDKSMDDLKSFIEAFKVEEVPNFIVLWDKDGKLAEEYGTEVLPESFLLSPGLKLERKIVGVEDWDQPLALEYFKSLTKKKK